MEAHEDILKREIRKAELKEINDELFPLLIDLVNEGTWILREAFTRYDDNRENLAVPLLCYSQLEMLDAMSVLCKEAICIPAYVQLRSIYESYNYCRFLDQDQKMFKKRGIAYVYEFHRQNIRIGKRLEEINGEISDWTEHMQKLSDGGFAEVMKEHDRTKEKFKEQHCGRPHAWYSLYDGPETLSALVDVVYAHIPSDAEGGSMSNNTLYAIESQVGHANDHFLRMFSPEEGGTQIRSFRTFNSIGDFVNCYGRAAMMTIFSLVILLKRNCSSGEKRGFDLWINKFQPRIHKLDPFR